MHIHILGICGTFMGSLAVLARELGHTVTGSDQGVYPPMSTQLEAQGIGLMEGYDSDNLKPQPDLVLVGNAMSRGNPEVEAVLNQNIDYMSGPESREGGSASSLGAGGRRNPWQNHHNRHVVVDSGAGRVGAGLSDRRGSQ